MRVAWIQDYSREEGGAEMSNKLVVHVGETLGFDIVGISPQNFRHEALLLCDVAVVNNFWQFEPWQTKTVLHALWEGRVPYVMYSHDYRDLARPAFAGPLFDRARLNVFISPRHKMLYEQALYVPRGVAFPLAIDAEGFVPQTGIERISGSAVIVSTAKQGPECTRYVTKHAGSMTATSLGKAFAGCKHVRPKQSFATMPAVYSEFEHLVHLPRKEWAGERIVFEAALCGCKVVANEKAGHMSWGWDLSNRAFVAEQLERAPYRFWRTIESRVT